MTNGGDDNEMVKYALPELYSTVSLTGGHFSQRNLEDDVASLYHGEAVKVLSLHHAKDSVLLSGLNSNEELDIWPGDCGSVVTIPRPSRESRAEIRVLRVLECGSTKDITRRICPNSQDHRP
ncbi:hypothetical protein Tco_1540618 [Tanacetum coccineum]